MTDQEIIDKIKFALNHWAFEDIWKALQGGAKMGSFILASCYIDYLTCYYFNADSTKQKYIDFANEFLPLYNGKDLYESLRCKLVHNYTEGGKYIFIDAKLALHLKVEQKSGRTLVNLENFLADLKNARDKYFELIDDVNQPFRQRALERFHKVGILGPMKVMAAQYSTWSYPASGYVDRK